MIILENPSFLSQELNPGCGWTAADLGRGGVLERDWEGKLH